MVVNRQGGAYKLTQIDFDVRADFFVVLGKDTYYVVEFLNVLAAVAGIEHRRVRMWSVKE